MVECVELVLVHRKRHVVLVLGLKEKLRVALAVPMMTRLAMKMNTETCSSLCNFFPLWLNRMKINMLSLFSIGPIETNPGRINHNQYR